MKLRLLVTVGPEISCTEQTLQYSHDFIQATHTNYFSVHCTIVLGGARRDSAGGAGGFRQVYTNLNCALETLLKLYPEWKRECLRLGATITFMISSIIIQIILISKTVFFAPGTELKGSRATVVTRFKSEVKTCCAKFLCYNAFHLLTSIETSFEFAPLFCQQCIIVFRAGTTLEKWSWNCCSVWNTTRPSENIDKHLWFSDNICCDRDAGKGWNEEKITGTDKLAFHQTWAGLVTWSTFSVELG